VKVGWIHKDELVEKKLKMGDVLHIDAGSTFYMLNTGKGQRLQVICSIDASDSTGFGPYQVMPCLFCIYNHLAYSWNISIAYMCTN
jgi:hypothetical protein